MQEEKNNLVWRSSFWIHSKIEESLFESHWNHTQENRTRASSTFRPTCLPVPVDMEYSSITWKLPSYTELWTSYRDRTGSKARMEGERQDSQAPSCLWDLEHARPKPSSLCVGADPIVTASTAGLTFRLSLSIVVLAVLSC